LSIADLCLNISDTLSANDVLTVMGAGDTKSIISLIAQISKSDFAGCLGSIDVMFAKGKSANVLAKDICLVARDMMLLKTAPQLYKGTAESKQELLAVQKDLSLEFLVTVIEIFSSLDAELRYSVSPRVVIETACIRACKLAVVDLSAISERLDRLERKINSGNIGIVPMQQKSEERTAETPTNPQKVWGKIITELRKNESMRIQTLAGNHSDVAILGNTLVVYAGNENYLEFCEDSVVLAIEKAIASLGYNLKLKIEKKVGEVDMDEEIIKIKKLVGNSIPINIKR